jgi:hypothetical protein
MGFDPETVGVYFIPGTFPISAMRDRIRKEMQAIGDFSLVVIDTSAAFFEGEDENSNAQQGVHARRLRGLCEMPGGSLCARIGREHSWNLRLLINYLSNFCKGSRDGVCLSSVGEQRRRWWSRKNAVRRRGRCNAHAVRITSWLGADPFGGENERWRCCGSQVWRSTNDRARN